MKQVIVFPRGQLSAKDKERLTKAQIIAVEADDPRSVVVALPAATVVGGDDMLMAALAGVLQGYDSCSSAFTKELYRRLKVLEQQSTAPSAAGDRKEIK